jgi:hypothetical protein
MTKIGQAVLALFDSTFKLEIPIPAQKEGVCGNRSLKQKVFVLKPPKGTSLCQTVSIDIYYVGVERPASDVRVPEKRVRKMHNGSRQLHPYGET